MMHQCSFCSNEMQVSTDGKYPIGSIIPCDCRGVRGIIMLNGTTCSKCGTVWTDNSSCNCMSINKVENPKHYQLKSGRQVKDVIEESVDDYISYLRGNVLKYILRAGKKEDTIQDLEKAKEYIKIEIAYRSKKDA
jgi:hypothetical protein